MSQPLEDEFGDIIKKARRGLGYSPEDIHLRTGIDPAVLAALEGYRRKPTAEESRALSASLQLDGRKLWDIARSTWSPRTDPWADDPGATVLVVPINVGDYIENCYVIGCRASRRALVVDPGGSPDDIVQAVIEAGLAVDAIAITHGHSDHTGAVDLLAAKIGCRVVIGHEESLRPLINLHLQTREVTDGDEFSIGDLRFETIHTPGHTFGGCCYLSGRICCVGDTLFAGSVGGAMGGPASYQTLIDSVRSKLLKLPPNTTLLPGHGPATTVEEELQHNPFF